MKRMRTVNEAYEEIKKQDNGTSLTPNAIRILCKQNKIKFVLIGRKYLIDLDSLINYFEGN